MHAMPIAHRKTRNGPPTLADSSSEPAHNIYDRMLENSDTTNHVDNVPADTMRHHESPAEEKEEDTEYVRTI